MAVSELGCQLCPRFYCEEDSVLLGYKCVVVSQQTGRTQTKKGRSTVHFVRCRLQCLCVVAYLLATGLNTGVDWSKEQEFDPNGQNGARRLWTDQHSQVDILKSAQQVPLKQQVPQCWQASQTLKLSDLICS